MSLAVKLADYIRAAFSGIYIETFGGMAEIP